MMKSGASQLKGWADKFLCRKVIGTALLVAAISAGCGGVPQTHYYTLRTPPPPSTRQAKTSFVLQIEQFDAPEMLRDERIVYYTSPTELNFSQYHRWSSSPTALLSELAVKYFAETGLFKGVYSYPAPVRADYTLRGRLLDFAELNYEKSENGKGRKARAGLTLDLVRTRDNEVVWSGRKEVEVPVGKKGMQSVVHALNTASQELLRDAFSGMAGVVEREATQEQEKSH